MEMVQENLKAAGFSQKEIVDFIGRGEQLNPMHYKAGDDWKILTNVAGKEEASRKSGSENALIK